MEKNRRGFLGCLLAVAVGPLLAKVAVAQPVAVVSTNVGKPTPLGRGMTKSIRHVDEAGFVPDEFGHLDLSADADQSAESWYQDNGWHHFALVRKDGVTTMYLDGAEVTHLPDSFVSWGKNHEPAIFVETVRGDYRELDLRQAQPGATFKVITPSGNLVMRDGKLRAVS